MLRETRNALQLLGAAELLHQKLMFGAERDGDSSVLLTVPLDFICAAITNTDGIAAFSKREMKQKFNKNHAGNEARGN